jgi:hypothetical protein
MQPQTTEIVGHRTSGVRGELTPEEAGDQGSEVAVAEAVWQVGEVADRLEQSQNARIAQAQSWYALFAGQHWLLHALQKRG